VLIDCRRFSGTRWGVAKLVRRLTLDQVILGSNPSAPANVLQSDAPQEILGCRDFDMQLLWLAGHARE
jgi:hypothetical protein